MGTMSGCYFVDPVCVSGSASAQLRSSWGGVIRVAPDFHSAVRWWSKMELMTAWS